MPMYRLPGGVLGRAQTLAGQHAFVQQPEFFDHQCLHAHLLTGGAGSAKSCLMARYSCVERS
jgi:hypothetical protein